MDHLAWGMEPEHGSYIIKIVREMGWAELSGNVMVPLSPTRIWAHLHLKKLEVTPLEYEMILETSVAYVGAYYDDRDIDPAWWTEYSGLLIPLRPLKGMKIVKIGDLWKEVPDGK